MHVAHHALAQGVATALRVGIQLALYAEGAVLVHIWRGSGGAVYDRGIRWLQNRKVAVHAPLTTANFSIKEAGAELVTLVVTTTA